MAEREPISINIVRSELPISPKDGLLKRLKGLFIKPKNEVKILDEKLLYK